MVAIRPRCCPSCGKTMRLPRPIANPDCAPELHIIFECQECGLSLIESATPPEVFVASATIGAKLRHFLADDSGATAIEYGLIAAGISIAIVSAVKGVGTKLNTTFSSISSQLQ
jgi:pilus assembly protein Flp/PilA